MAARSASCVFSNLDAEVVVVHGVYPVKRMLDTLIEETLI